MISLDEALAIIAKCEAAPAREHVSLDRAIGRFSAGDVHAKLTQPPFNASAMDGYAVRFDDAQRGAALRVIGTAPAGAPFEGEVPAGTALRVFTGSLVPEGLDHVIIQEHVRRNAEVIIIEQAQPSARNIRSAGTDFKKGDTVLANAQPISPIDVTLLAASNIATLDVCVRPVIAYFDNGDELQEPGSELSAGQIIGSNRFAIDGLIVRWGGQPLYLGRAPDSLDAVKDMFMAGQHADVIVPIGGASVGDHDYMRRAFSDCGGQMLFEKIAVKPGKPTWMGDLDGSYVLGLPGNPASAIVCAILCLQPLIKTLMGRDPSHSAITAELSAPLPANGPRETYVRAHIDVSRDGALSVTPVDLQDSSLISRLASANALIKCAPHSHAKKKGDRVRCLPYQSLF